ncbi:MAG: T9SS type A sorting domain-containing protein [Flavobacteriales bacterium]|jgi:hypothetical protein
MKKALTVIVLYLFLSLFNVLQSQQENNFCIGMFGSDAGKLEFYSSGCLLPFEVPINGGYKTSVLNVLSEDGFNMAQLYRPSEGTSIRWLQSYLKLIEANGMKAELSLMHTYKPSITPKGFILNSGTNVYNNCGLDINECETPESINSFRPDYDKFVDQVFNVQPYKSIIWGFHITEEASYYHPVQFSTNCAGWNWNDSTYFWKKEVPPSNVLQSIEYFNSAIDESHTHKFVVMEANHHKQIPTSHDLQGIYQPQSYVQLLLGYQQNGVFFEGSYCQFPATAWINQNYNTTNIEDPLSYNYLGCFKSIEYGKSYSTNVHKVVSGELRNEQNDPNYAYHFHSNLNKPNANWLWFNAYTSIIHGANGVWFWHLDFMYNNGESMEWGNTQIPNRFDRQYFPEHYKKYVAHLARELRFLVNKNILSTDTKSIVCSKTDQSDPNCIIPSSVTYIPTSLPINKRYESYGLRYTIRTNGEEVYMIVSNPLNITVNVPFNFQNVSNNIVRNSTGLQIMFENYTTNTSSNTYKVNRDSNINLQAGTVGVTSFKSYNAGTKEVTLTFGPLDVKIIKFVSTTPINLNGWEEVWSNNGNGTIENHLIRDNDIFYNADLDGDGAQELLCVASTPGGSDWMNIFKFDGENWNLFWTNSGNPNNGAGIYPYLKHLVCGDFDADGKDELLGNVPGNGWTTMFEWSGSNFSWVWSDFGNASHAMRPYKHKFYSGKFNSQTKSSLLGVNGENNGWITMFTWNGSNFIWAWSDLGNSSNPIRNYKNNLVVSDFDGDGFDELLGMNTWATFFEFQGNQWNWVWSNYGVGGIAGWTLPFSAPMLPSLTTTYLCTGNLDGDSSHELFLISSGSSGVAGVTSLNQLSNQNAPSWFINSNTAPFIPYLGTWNIVNPGNSNSARYHMIKAVSNEKSKLLALRKWCENKYEAVLLSPTLLGNLSEESNQESENSNLDIGNQDVVSIEESSSSEVMVRPNPTNGRVEIISKTRLINRMEILNAVGEVVYSKINNYENSNVLELTSFMSGVYYIKVYFENGESEVYKIVKL